MATSYPGAVDNFTNPTTSDPMNSATVPHASQHANVNDAVEAVQTELGTNPKGGAASVKARLDASDAQLLATTQTLDYRVKGYTSSAQPASPVAGDLWVDPDDSSIKVWDGAAFVNPSNAGGGGLPWAVVSGGTVTEYTHPTHGVMQVHTFAANGTLVVATEGLADVLVVSSGTGSGVAYPSGGRVVSGLHTLPVGNQAVTIGPGVNDSFIGNESILGPLVAGRTPAPQDSKGTGAGATAADRLKGLVSSVTGSAVEYAQARVITTPGSAFQNGVVIVAVKKP